jgi:phosphate acetyltransferase
MDLMEQLVARAKANKQRIVLAEGTEERTLKAADQILADGVADIILIGSKTEIEGLAAQFGLKNIDKATIIDPKNNPEKEKYANLLYELRKKKGMTPEQASELAENPLYLGALIIKNGEADGEVAGARNTTGDVLRPALQIIKTAPGISCVSGAFVMFIPNKVYGQDGIMVFADCAVTPNPDASQLAQIAVCAGQTAKDIAGIDPIVGMLSFSTKGSAKHEMVDKVVEATRLAKELDPNLVIDGDLQADAAIVPSVGASKAPGSAVAGHCNTLVFPSLEVGNIAYKLVQRLAGATAVGPILQGIAAPVNDLSRGCSTDDVYKVISITCNQAIGAKERAAKA